MADPDAAQHWETRYADSTRVWSGRPNHTFVDIARGLQPGRALDLGCGEGGDAIWLAANGWQVTGVDISPTAISRAARAADSAGIPAERIRWLAKDLATWNDDHSTFDLVSACFLQAWFEFPRTEILRRFAKAIAPGGHLLVISHAEPPPWADLPDDHDHVFPTPTDEIEGLHMAGSGWETVISDTRSRNATGPNGQHGVLTDSVVLLRKR